MPTAGVTHDLTLASGTTTLGLMLWRGRNGSRGFSIRDARTIEPRVLSMGELTEAEFPAQYALYASQTDWRGGLGGFTQGQAEDSGKLAMGYKIDASVRGLIQNARQVTSTAVAATNPDNYKPSGFAIVGTQVWAFVGRDVYQWNYANKNWDIGTEPQAVNVTYRNGVTLGANTFAACWDSSDVPTRYIYKAQADAAWTLVAVSAGNYPKYMAVGKNAAGTDIMFGGGFGSGATNNLRTAADPTAPANWSSAIAIGNADAPITGLVQDRDTMVVCKTNGLWAYYSDGTQENLTPSFTADAHPSNFIGAFNWNNHVLLPLGNGGMMELVDGNLYDVSLKIYAPKQTTLTGRVAAITGDPQSLFILVQEAATNSFHLLMAKWVEVNGRQDYRWHHLGNIVYATGTVVEHAALLSEGVPSGSTIHRRVWIGVESTATSGANSNLLPYFLPQEFDAQDGFTNDTDAIATSVEFDFNLPKVDKTFASLDMETANLGAGGRLYTVEFRLDGGAWQSSLVFTGGTVGTNICDVSPAQTATFPVSATGKILELRFKPSLTAVGTTSPQILSFRITAQLRPAALKTLPVRLYLADGQRLLNGAFGGSPVNQLSQLEAWNTQAAELTVVDARKVSRSMVSLPGYMRVTEVAHELYRRSEYRVDLLLATV